jgi:outer membrane lipoprotein carrier protein
MIRIPAIVLLTLLSTAALADATDALLEQLGAIHTLEGAFTQQQHAEGIDAPIVSSGHFKLLRPGYFAWEIESPDSQLILATPEYLWHYDRDLETVTRRPVDNSARMSPLQVLGGDSEALRARYAVEQVGEAVYRLTPRDSDAGFRSLEVTFGDGEITDMSIEDNLGQQVEVAFSEVKTDAPLTAKDFAFTPPEGADLFYYDQ